MKLEHKQIVLSPLLNIKAMSVKNASKDPSIRDRDVLNFRFIGETIKGDAENEAWDQLVSQFNNKRQTKYASAPGLFYTKIKSNHRPKIFNELGDELHGDEIPEFSYKTGSGQARAVVELNMEPQTAEGQPTFYLKELHINMATLDPGQVEASTGQEGSLVADILAKKRQETA